MSHYLNTSIGAGVSIDLSNSWAGRSLQEVLRQAQRDARFQQRQMQEKEEKLLRLYETQQQRAFDKVSRSSSGGSSMSGGTSPVGLSSTLGSTGGGRVRQMFDERRQKAGIDRSYPLEPLKQTTRLNGHAPANRVSSLDRSSTITKNPSNRQTVTMKAAVQRTVSHSQTGRPPQNRTVKRIANATYTNGKLIHENSTYEDRNENDYAINSLKQQQRDLEMMMNNHNIDDSLEDEEMPNVGIDEIDEGREYSPSPNENDYYEDKKKISNGNFARNHDIISSPTKTISRTSPSTKKVINNNKPVNSPKSPPRVADNVKRSPKMAAPPPATRSTVGPRQAASRNTKTTKSVQSSIANDNLVVCKFCQRRFATDRLGKHEEICARTLKKKRKAYDAVKHRVAGTEVEQYVKKGPKGTSVKVSKPPQMPKTDWRRQHEDFIATIRAAKVAQAHVAAGGKITDLPPPPPSYNPDYVQCPHCGRRFNEAAAERHIPKCATMLHNKPNRLTNASVQKKRY